MKAPLGQQSVVGEESRGVVSLVVVAVSGLDGVGGQEDGGLGRAVDLVGQDRVLDLQIEQSQRDVLDQLFGHVFRVELGPELELQRVLLLHVLAHHLQHSSMCETSKRFKTCQSVGYR